jgi:hypothetical protein
MFTPLANMYTADFKGNIYCCKQVKSLFNLYTNRWVPVNPINNPKNLNPKI